MYVVAKRENKEMKTLNVGNTTVNGMRGIGFGGGEGDGEGPGCWDIGWIYFS